MITNSFEATGAGDPKYVGVSKILGLSLTGFGVGTMKLQRHFNDSANYPAPGDTGWRDVDSFTADVEDQIADAVPGWYRWYCSAYTSGTIVGVLV